MYAARRRSSSAKIEPSRVDTKSTSRPTVFQETVAGSAMRALKSSGYRAICDARGEAPLGYAEPRDKRIIEYDDDVLRAFAHESTTDWGDDATEWEP